ncbi:MAG TPA: dTDP-4-dehydrorhamnose reductase [Phyllobacterium sp.]|nr:dTDP-4-dehydrorhamnose reductase [Phyllobacterium sp.]
MRILLTGTSGQVGRALRPLLEGENDLLTPGRADFDLANPAVLAAALDGLKPELIINPAAYTAVDRAEDEADLAFRVNAEAPSVIARWTARHHVPLVHFSTDYIFDGSGDRPWREDGPTGPLSVYGASKLAGEQAIAEAGCPHLIVRTSWVYAAKGTNFLRTIARLAGERKELRIVADQIGAPTSARVIAQAVVAILRAETAGLADGFARSGGVVNVACAGQTSWQGFASAIVAGLRSRGVKLEVESVAPIKTSDYPTKAKRPGNSRLDLSRLEDVFGVVTPSWNEALAVELDELTRELR